MRRPAHLPQLTEIRRFHTIFAISGPWTRRKSNRDEAKMSASRCSEDLLR